MLANDRQTSILFVDIYMLATAFIYVTWKLEQIICHSYSIENLCLIYYVVQRWNKLQIIANTKHECKDEQSSNVTSSGREKKQSNRRNMESVVIELYPIVCP